MYAKDLNQLIQEFPANGTFYEKRAYVSANKTDIAKEFNTFKSSELAMVPYNATATSDERKTSDSQYRLFTIYYSMFHSEITDVNDLVALHLSARIFVENKAKYNKLKANNWTINNVYVNKPHIISCLIQAQDIDLLISFLPGSGKTVDYLWDSIKKLVITSAPTDKAIKILDLCENEMLLNNLNTNLEDCQTVRKVLTMRKISN